MVIGRYIGWLFLAAALAVLVWDVVLWMDGGGAPATALGQHWYDLDRASLGGLQVVIERYIWPLLWQPVAWTLIRPTWLVFGILGLALAVIFRRRRR
jgi:hypothetical protein